MTRRERPTATTAFWAPRRRAMRRYRSPRKLSVRAAPTAASPRTRARYRLPCPVEPLPFFFPADSFTPGVNLAHEHRWAAVGKRRPATRPSAGAPSLAALLAQPPLV